MSKNDAGPAIEQGHDLLDHLPLGLFIISSDMRVEFWNTWLEEYTGIKKDAIHGRIISELYPHLNEPKYKDRIQAIFSGAPPTIFSSLLHKYIIPIKRKNGSFHIQNTTLIPLPAPNGEMRVLFAINDVTDLTNRINESRSMRDRAVEAKNMAEEATRIKDRFVALVSHDLKNPLTSIIGFMQIINNELETLSKSDIKYMVGVAIESGENMRQLIDDVLSISRIKSGKMVINHKFIDAFGIILKAHVALRPLAEKKNVVVDVQVPQKTRINGDPVLLEQVLQNLISNAIKFCNDGDRITISIPQGEKSVISVADTGVGIQIPNLEDLFNHEIKTSTPGTAGEMGTGFGLPLSKDIMEAHGGTLVVRTELGKGSEFFMRLPDVKPLVLVVDDDKLPREIIKKIIKPLDVRIVEAQTGQEALDVIAKENPHLVIVDLVMPGMDGHELIRRIRGNVATEKLPIIVITSDASLEPREKAMQLGADDFVLKNADPNDIILRVSRYVSV
jgi:PAS domain S-box-containing protein